MSILWIFIHEIRLFCMLKYKIFYCLLGFYHAWFLSQRHVVIMTVRIQNFFKDSPHSTPCLVIDLEVIKAKFLEFQQTMPKTKIYYAVKANPAPEILKLLVELGSYFDTASVQEIKMCFDAGATADKISYGNTIKKERDIATAYGMGVRLFAFDSQNELEKLARVAPKSKLMCRILCDCKGAQWPLSRKFGCESDMAQELLENAHKLGMIPVGVSFHVGSQQINLHTWDDALAGAAKIFHDLAEKNIHLSLVNMGGGFPAQYLTVTPDTQDYSDAIDASLRKHFGDNIPDTIIEPGRGLVGQAGVIQTEVVLISQKSKYDDVRWVYLDIGKFGGLAETMDEAIRYPITTPHDDDNTAPCIIAGPTCDSVDILYEQNTYPLPVSLEIGDKVYIHATGAYTTTYASVAFNGFEPLKYYCI